MNILNTAIVRIVCENSEGTNFHEYKFKLYPESPLMKLISAQLSFEKELEARYLERLSKAERELHLLQNPYYAFPDILSVLGEQINNEKEEKKDVQT